MTDFTNPGQFPWVPLKGRERRAYERACRRMAAERRDPLLTLPRRTRARLAVTRAVDGAAIWLVDRGQLRAAERLWHAFGMMRERSSR